MPLTEETALKSVRYNLDAPVGPGPFRYSPGDELEIAGWAFLEPPDAVLPSIVLESVSLSTGAVTRLDVRTCSRADVARHFGIEALHTSGFSSTTRVDYRLSGEQRVRLLLFEGPVLHLAVDLFSFTVTPTTYEANARRDLAARFLRGAGLEVGALQRRLEVPAHCSVTFVDRLPLAELLEHYPELRGQPLQAPDIIDDGETLAKVGAATQDFVIANHFLEHCENPIQTIQNFLRVLKNGGILYMAIPDKRFTFDADRPQTAYRTLAETFRHGRRQDRAGLYLEWAALVARVPPSDVAAVGEKLQAEQYSIHFNVWALPNLLEFIATCRTEFNLPFELEWMVCSENEVILILRKHVSTRLEA